ncbi:hypothetical protein F8388_006992 [Cannabis sativa]|uniref:Germin-like protein n=2 Tax=Cannabis sativa TaxID=3483 RepID=A0AB40E9Y1_CANSA|nr:hypothetical protein F8388_006992 [Cannabis sativa]KAF4382317.1 hypothetical protein G4B88_011269 [Cannabis sativa]
MAGDPDILTDFVIPPNLSASNITSSFFTYTGLRTISTASTFNVTKVSMSEFAALNGQSISYAVLQYPGGTANPPHVHPRSAELLLLIQGSLEVGFVDTTNKLYTQTIEAGDIFVFPKGLVHFQYNADSNTFAAALSAFGSANAGTSSVPKALFANDIDDEALAVSFMTDVATIQKLKAGLASKP